MKHTDTHLIHTWNTETHLTYTQKYTGNAQETCETHRSRQKHTSADWPQQREASHHKPTVFSEARKWEATPIHTLTKKWGRRTVTFTMSEAHIQIFHLWKKTSCARQKPPVVFREHVSSVLCGLRLQTIRGSYTVPGLNTECWVNVNGVEPLYHSS